MKKIGIIGAMSVEVELLRNEMNNVSTHKIGRLEFWDGLIGGVSVVVVKSGVGKVNAALCTQMLIDRFAVTHVINTGVAGAFASGLDVLDIVISTEVMYHDVDVTAWEGYEPCTLPGMEKTFVADSEEQALNSFNVVYNMLEDNKEVMRKYFYWNKTEVINKITHSILRYNTANAKTKELSRRNTTTYYSQQKAKNIKEPTTS